MHFKTIFLFLVLSLTSVSAKSDTISELYKIAVSIKECLINKFPGVCLKERALESLNESAHTDEPIMLGFIRIEKNDGFNWNKSIMVNELSTEVSQRSSQLGDALYDKLMEFLKSRTIRLNIDDAVEGRGKKGGGKGGGKGMMMMGGAAACMMAGMMMGKMGVVAMGAMMMAKIAMAMSAMMAIKKD